MVTGCVKTDGVGAGALACCGCGWGAGVSAEGAAVVVAGVVAG